MVRQVAVNGQLSLPSQAMAFVLDTEAPEAPTLALGSDGLASSDAGASSQNTTLPETVPSTDSGSVSVLGVEEGALLQFSIDGGQVWHDAFEAQPGLNQLQVRQIDKAGNVSLASAV